MQICIFEDNQYKNFLPLVYFRAVFELRSGAMSLRENIESIFPRSRVSLCVRTVLTPLVREENPRVLVNELHDDDTWFINGRVLADDGFVMLMRKYSGSDCVLKSNGEVAAAFVQRSSLPRFRQFTSTFLAENVFDSLTAHSCNVTMVHYPWELVHYSSNEIEKDFRRLVKKMKNGQRLGKIYKGANLINPKNIIIGKGSVIKPGVVIDAERGPVIIGSNVTIMPNAVIEGPAFIGDRTVIKIGAKIYHGTSIGTYCKVGGEVDASIIQSYSNKQHDGFLGHSYLGSWVNLGADTNTSDLKNTYSNVNVKLNGKTVDTRMQFVGLMMSDHSKTGINVMFDTGTIVGVSCNIYGAGLPPKELPSFAWGERGKFTVYEREKGLEIARRVMARRDIVMTKAYEELFRNVFDSAEGDRKREGVV
jgi:UDP-N-acetylglucosamine diphosphorylase/glucosamine-1-phosphate N-acetyltransferase